jgi:hypothetical protein
MIVSELSNSKLMVLFIHCMWQAMSYFLLYPKKSFWGGSGWYKEKNWLFSIAILSQWSNFPYKCLSYGLQQSNWLLLSSSVKIIFVTQILFSVWRWLSSLKICYSFGFLIIQSGITFIFTVSCFTYKLLLLYLLFLWRGARSYFSVSCIICHEY